MENTATIVAQSPTTANTSFAEIDRFYALQQTNKFNLKKTTAKERKEKLVKFKNAVLNNRTAIQEALQIDLRKAAVETDYTEVYGIIAEIKHTISNLSDWMAAEEVETPLMYIGSSSKIVYEAKGACLILSPWNYPIQLPLLNLVSCVAAGNSAIIKPSEFTPNAANILKKIITESFAENEVAVVMGDISVSTHLLDKKFDHIHFTGSPAVGKIVMKAAAEHLTSVTLELGGKSPVIIDDSANIDAAVKKLVWGKFVNLGQTCIAPDYILIDEKRKEEFITKFKAQLVKSFGENAQQSKDLARIINAKNHQRLCGILEDAVNKGATIAVGGNADEKDKFIYPTLLTNVSDDMRIMNEEIFGPLLPMKTYSKIEDAIAYINQKEKPLSLYVFSQKSAIQDLVINSTSAGGSCINDNVVHFSQPYLPFGGINNSGIGKSHGVFGFKEFSNSRAVLKALHSGSIAMPLWFPYGSLVRKVVDIMIKYL